MLTLKTWSAIVVVLIAALSVLSDASPVTATDRHRDKPDAVNVTNKSTNPVPVVVGNGRTAAIPVFVTNMPAVMGGGGTTTGGTATGEEGAQFIGVNDPTFLFVSFPDAQLQRVGKRFVVDFVATDLGLTMNDCSLLQVRIADSQSREVARAVMTLHGNASGLWGGSQSMKLFVDPGSRILVMPFQPGCDPTGITVTVVGHYIPQ